jgi:hypothetical protein
MRGKVDPGFDTASAKDLQARGSSRSSGKRSPMPRKSRTVPSGSNRRCWRRSNTGRSQPRARCVILSSRASGRTHELGQGLDLGNRHCRRTPRNPRRNLLFDPRFRAWLNWLGPSHCEDPDETHCTFAAMRPDKHPQDPHLDVTGLRFETMEHRGKHPDTMLKPSN